MDMRKEDSAVNIILQLSALAIQPLNDDVSSHNSPYRTRRYSLLVI